MSGPNVSATPTGIMVDVRLNELLEELESQQRSLGLPAVNTDLHNEATALMDVTRDGLRGMSAEHLAESAILLQRFGFYLQRRYNRCIATRNWCESGIRHAIAETVGKVTGYSLEERRPLAIRQSVVATKLNKLKVKAESLATDIEYMAVRVEYQARLFSNLAGIKVKQHG